MTAIDFIMVAIGGGTGSVLRWQLGVWVAKKYHGSFPLGTFIINISGAFIIGFLSAFFIVDWHQRYGDFLHAAVLTGLLGGYTTFSSMQLDAAKLAVKKQVLACFYLVISVVVGLLAAALGASLAYL